MNNEPGEILLKIRNRENIIFDGLVSSISSVNDTGKFDILPEHANFISLIKDVITIRDVGGKTREIKIGSGILRVLNNRASIYLGIRG